MNVLHLHPDIQPAAQRIIEEASASLSKLAQAPVRVIPIYNYELRSEAELQAIVCAEYNVSWKDIKGKSQRREIVAARQSYCYLCRLLLKKTLVSIAESIGGRDHTTVIHAIQSVKDHIDTGDRLVANHIHRILQLIKYEA